MEGDEQDFAKALDQLEREVESGVACRAYMAQVWRVAESFPLSNTGGTETPTEEWISLDEEATP